VPSKQQSTKNIKCFDKEVGKYWLIEVP